MNKEILDCIKAGKDKQTQKEAEKNAMIAEIKNFFKDLPEGEYIVDLVNRVEVKRRDHWYSKSFTYIKSIKKEAWCEIIGNEWIEIKVDKGVNIDRGVGDRVHGQNIERWSNNAVMVFNEHLDWFEQELKREYCRKA